VYLLKIFASLAIGGDMSLKYCRLTVFGILAISGLANAQTADSGYPSHPVHVVVPVDPGGSTDLQARIMTKGLTQMLGVPFIVDNRPGAGGIIGTDMVAKAAPDGYTLLFAQAGHTIIPFIFKKVPYNVYKDFTPITLVATSPLVLTINPAVGANSVKELIEIAKAKPGKLNVALSTLSSSGALLAEWFKSATNTDIVSVPFKGGSPAMTAVMSNEVQFIFATIPAALPFVKDGRLKMLAMSGTKRFPQLPEVPTLDESGLKGFEAEPWGGFLGPANMPRAVVDRIQRACIAILSRNDVRQTLIATGNVPVGSTPQEFANKLDRELKQNAKIVKDVGMKAD
jgi:tripartite-type tricarboxylate transporter receptor subunit TctC